MNQAYGPLATVYDRLNAREQTDWLKAVPEILADMGILPGSPLADMACGTGRLTVRLAEMGYAVTGTDGSEAMLEEAYAHARRARLRLPLVLQDMRGFSLPHPVAAVLCMCDGLNYLRTPDDLTRTLRAVWRNLLPGGWFLADTSSPTKLRTMDGEFYGLEQEDCAYLWSNTLDDGGKLLTMSLTLFLRERDGRFRREHETHIQRLTEAEELTVALEATGFGEISLTEAFTGQPITASVQRYCIRARKPAE